MRPNKICFMQKNKNLSFIIISGPILFMSYLGQLQKEASFEQASASPPQSPLVGRRHSDVSPSRLNANYANNSSNANYVDGNLGIPHRKDGTVSPRFSAADRRR